VKPKLIVALGVSASKGLLGAEVFRSLREIKGTWLDFEGIPVLPTYHPSYLLRNDSKRDKRGAWEDLLKVMERCEVLISEKQRGFFL
jgi:DNA polymerase